MSRFTIQYASGPVNYVIQFAKGTGPQGIPGPGGGGGGGSANTILHGVGAPSNSLGADGDFYVDTAEYFLYGPKASGAWSTYVEMLGANGANGLNADMYMASQSSVAIGTGSKSFTFTTLTQNSGWATGTRLRAYNSAGRWMEGVVTARSTTEVTINVDLAVGSGTFAQWFLSIAGEPGAQGLQGIPGNTGAPGRGITSIAKTGTAGLVDTYTITYSDGGTSTFQVTNGANGTNGSAGADGRGITSIAKTGTAGQVDTYTITYSDSTTSTFTVTNGTNGTNGTDGRGITSIARTGGTGTAGSTDTYTITYSDSSTSTFTVVNGSNGSNGSNGTNGSNGLNADMTRSSSSSNTIGLGSSTFTYTSSSNLGWVVGMRLRASAGGSNWEEGAITAVSATSVTINVDLISGSGTFTSWTLGVAGERGAAGSGGGSGAAPQLSHYPIANAYLTRRGTGASTASLVANRRFYHLVYVAETRTFTELTVTVTGAAAGSSIRLGLRNCNQATGQPTSLIVETGLIDSSTTGLKQSTINQTLSPGWYILEITSNGTPTVGAYSAPEASFGTEVSAAGVNPIPTLFRDVAFGSLASDESGNTMARSSTGVIVGIR